MNNEIEQKINKIFIDCIKANWNGYGASPIPIELKQIILDFIGDMPNGVKMPHISPNASGVISLTWFNNDRSKELIADIAKDGKLHFNYFENKKEEWFDDFYKKGCFPETLKSILEKHFFDPKYKMNLAGFKTQKELALHLDATQQRIGRLLKGDKTLSEYLKCCIKLNEKDEEIEKLKNDLSVFRQYCNQ